METLNHVDSNIDSESRSVRKAFEVFLTHLFPYAPHVSSELMTQLGIKLDLNIDYDHLISNLSN